MERTINVLIADSNEDFKSLLVEAVQNEPGLNLIGSSANGADALTMIIDRKPDVVVSELLLQWLDGLALFGSNKQNGR